MLKFTDRFLSKFGSGAAATVSDIYNRYFEGKIHADVRVTYTRSRRVLGKADLTSNTIYLRKIDKHTIAHELMHLAQACPENGIPSGERACDVYTNALGPDVAMRSYYIKTWGAPAEAIHAACKEALEKRAQGMTRYIVYAEERLHSASRGVAVIEAWRSFFR